MKYSVMVARFPYLNQECPDTTDWLIRTVLKMKQDERIGEVLHVRKDDTPVTMTRNAVCLSALQQKCDYLLMVDSDMKPDCEPDGKPFWDTSWEWILSPQQLGKPSMVAAPYCGPPPHENVYIFQWANWRNDAANPDIRLEQFSREQASAMRGIQEVGALPTGVILIDCRVLRGLKPPWFSYEYDDRFEASKASTEDVVFTRDASLQGMPVYCNWDAWAGHWKRLLVRKPRPLTKEDVRGRFAEAVLAERSGREVIVDVPEQGIRVRDLVKARDGAVVS